MDWTEEEGKSSLHEIILNCYPYSRKNNDGGNDNSDNDEQFILR